MSEPNISDGERLAHAGLLAPSYIDFGADDYRDFYTKFSLHTRPEDYEQLPEMTGIERAMHFRTKVLAEHGRGKGNMQEIIERNMPSDLQGHWYIDAVRTAVGVLHTNFKNIGIEAAKLPVKDGSWLLPQAENPHVLREGDKRIKEYFPHGDFLFHSTTVEAAEGIMRHGQLLSSAEGVARHLVQHENTNSGTLSVSWSLNKVWAMPGTLYHLAGFLSSPQGIITKGNKLFVPTDAAIGEIQTMPGTGDVEQYKRNYEQFIMWRNAFTEYFRIADTQGVFYGNSNCKNTLRHYAKAQRKGELVLPFTFDGGVTQFDPQLLETNYSSLAVLTMAAAEGGDLREYGIENTKDLLNNTNDFIEQTAVSKVFELFVDESEVVFEKVLKAFNRKSPFDFPRFDTKELVFLCGNRDFENVWKKLFASLSPEKAPKAVITYEQDRVRIPNFVLEKGLGDHEKMTEEIRRTLPITPETFDWSKLMPKVDGAVHYKGVLRAIISAAFTRKAYELGMDSTGRLLAKR